MAAVMLLGAGAAWPVPSRLLPALLVNALAMVWLSRLTRHPAVHAAAAIWFAATWVLVVHLVRGAVTWSETTAAVVASALLSAATGHFSIRPEVALSPTNAPPAIGPVRDTDRRRASTASRMRKRSVPLAKGDHRGLPVTAEGEEVLQPPEDDAEEPFDGEEADCPSGRMRNGK